MLKGRTIVEKRDHFKRDFDGIRRMLMLEPRGHRDMFGAILLPPCDSKADIGLIFMDAGGYVNMCVHGSIGAVTAAIETGIVENKEPLTELTLDTPSGIVHATAKIEGSSVKSVTIHNMPAFLYHTSEVNLSDGKIPVDIAFGGNFFAIVDAKILGVRVDPSSCQQLVSIGLSIRQAVNSQIKIQHPEIEHLRSVDLVEICDVPTNPMANVKNATIFGAGQIDRSPCGTGTCAKMASLYAKGKLGINEEFVNESIIGTIFRGRLTGRAKVGNFDAVLPEVEGEAHVTGFSQFVLDPSDPIGDGFLLV
jgi:proline racemase